MAMRACGPPGYSLSADGQAPRFHRRRKEETAVKTDERNERMDN
jgi:hypothetical protein